MIFLMVTFEESVEFLRAEVRRVLTEWALEMAEEAREDGLRKWAPLEDFPRLMSTKQTRAGHVTRHAYESMRDEDEALLGLRLVRLVLKTQAQKQLKHLKRQQKVPKSQRNKS